MITERGLTPFIAFCLMLLLISGCGGSGSTGSSASGVLSISNPIDITVQNSVGAEVVARVFLNGEEKGLTPLEINGLTPGTYTLLLQSVGYKDYNTSVVVQSGTTTTVAATYTLEFLDLPEGPVFQKK